MSRTCTVCNHTDREGIDKALASGESCSSIAERYSTNGARLGRMALERHKVAHLPATVLKAQDQEEINRAGELLSSANDHADQILAQAEKLERLALAILGRSYEGGDYRNAVAAVNAARECLRLRAELLGKLKSVPIFNILINPQWLTLRATILQALGPYPEARESVVKALGNGHGNNSG